MLWHQPVLCQGMAEQYPENAKGSGIRQKLGCLAVAKILTAAVFLWIAMGCYESFMILWLAGLMLLLLTERIARGRQEKDIFATLVAGAVAALVAIVLRSVMIVVVTKAFHLEYLRGEAVQRSVTEMLGWMLQPGAFGELAMTSRGPLCCMVCLPMRICRSGFFHIISGCDPCGDAGAGDPQQRSVGTSVVACRLFGSVFSSVH